MHTHSLHSSGVSIPSYTFPNFSVMALGRWVGFEVLISCCDFSHFLGSVVHAKEGGDFSRRTSCE